MYPTDLAKINSVQLFSTAFKPYQHNKIISIHKNLIFKIFMYLIIWAVHTVSFF